MCTPIAAVMAVVAIAGAVTQARAQQQQAKAQQQQANFQAQVARNNAQLAQRAAAAARARGAIEEDARRRLTQQQIGRARVNLAASGQVIDEGSALDLTADIAGVGTLDALTIRNNAEREALGFEIQGGNFSANANALVSSGINARTAGDTAAFGTLLTGFAKAGSMLTFAPSGGGGLGAASTSRFGTAGAGQGFQTDVSGRLLRGI